ncbi:MAG: aspartyl/glutamyl-tRNA(Asn/Gln) amidotransferase subunit C [Fimbriimonadales bacterium]|nr:MAG: aspartyl/glutamyl-tRNA(Asn/Gln) amidotransferase subunit C [Fimbriimonadales bacterium]
MAISREELLKLAELARLNLSDQEIDAIQSDLNRVLEHFERLKELELGDVPLTPHSVDATNVWREDIPYENGLTREEALENAPEVRAGLFLVPSIIE